MDKESSELIKTLRQQLAKMEKTVFDIEEKYTKTIDSLKKENSKLEKQNKINTTKIANLERSVRKSQIEMNNIMQDISNIKQHLKR